MISWVWILVAVLAGFILGIIFHSWLEFICLPGREVKKLLEERRKNEVKNDNTSE